jgi:DNA polymerase I-like protein with 3'-5' exonuclease and polymerase domains
MSDDLNLYLKNTLVGDIETDNVIIDDVSKVHVSSVSYYDSDTDKWKLYSCPGDPETFATIHNMFSSKEKKYAGHNFFLYDIPILEKFGIPVDTSLYNDTLFISWYIEPKRKRHGLEEYGEDFGIPKPKVDDWKSLTYEEYKHRCEEDVKINTTLFHRQMRKLYNLYEGDMSMVESVLGLLRTKAKVYKMQQQNPLTLDVEGCKKRLEKLREMEKERIDILRKVMPPRKLKGKKSRPKVMYKKDGSLSANGEKWVSFIESKGYRLGEEPDVIEYIR